MRQNGSNRKNELPLSAVQQRLWVLEQLHPGSGGDHVALGLRWTGPIDPGSIKSALSETIRRHEILGAEFRSVDGAPTQVLTSPQVEIAFVDLQHLEEPERAEQLLQLAEQEDAKPFDLARGPLLRATHLQLAGKEQALLLVAHRILCDKASLRILLNEIHSIYRAQAGAGPAERAEIPLQYHEADSGKVSASELSYWTQRLAGAPSSVDLPTDRPRPAVQTFRCHSQRMLLESPLVQRLRELGQRHGATLFTTLLAAFNVLLYRYARQEDLVVGTRVSGRSRPGLDRVVGPLENMLALRVNLADDPGFADLLPRVHAAVEGAFAHQAVPFEGVVAELRLERDMSRHPLFQIMFDMPGARGRDPGAEMSWIEIDTRWEQFDLSVELHEADGAVGARFSYNTDLFDAATVVRMMEHFRILLEAAANDPARAISRLPLLSEGERHQIVVEWNDTAVEYPRDIPLHQLIEAQVDKTPDSTAVIYEQQRLTYRQLNDRANQLARYLQKGGVGPDVLVGVCAERSVEMVLALLAAMKAGGAYVPLDPDYPKDRLKAMLSDANPPVVLTQAHLLDRLPEGTENVFCLDRDWPSLAGESTENLPATVGGKNQAYAIYTSGSTGKPKGVPNVHEGIVNRLLWMQDMYHLTGKDRVLQKTPFSFDVSVWEFFWPLLTGATLVVARPGGHRDPAYLVNLIAEQGITTLHFVPSMLSIFLESAGLERCGSVRQVFASGEALPFELQQRFFERMRAKLHNLYGPTEAAVDVTYWECKPDNKQTVVPIGRPIANTQIRILDSNLQPTPIGVPGELHIGGIGIARGYLNRPELTKEKFIPDPFSKATGARLYKTGDLARFLPDGNIEYLGRTDFQVKVRGLRIELGEIEAVLGQCDGVLQAVVAVREDAPGDKRLIAYLIAAPGGEPPVENLRRELKDRLPDYMVPSRFIFVEKFPMTTSGKVDRKALPAPPLEQGTGFGMVAPRNEVEATLTSLFAKVLGLPSVGVTDNFFDLGGHSLLAGRLLAQVQAATGRQIPLSAMFRGATVESLAKLVTLGSGVDHEPVVMEIQHGDSSRLPFFAIVPPGEESIGYAMLARHMGPRQTVYKIQGHAPVTYGKRPYTDEEMKALTSEYLAAMRSVQAHGPYCLGGLCDGTHIAEQIVLKLESQGEEAGLFAIFDTWVLQHSQNRWLWKIYYYGERLKGMKKLSLSERLRSYQRVARNKAQSLIGTAPARTDWKQAYWPENFTATRFRAPVILFKRPKQPFYYINDPQMGWGARTTSGVQIYEVDFPHMEILREPHVRIFGEELAGCITRATEPAAVLAGNQEASLVATSLGQRNS
ncbi:MAG TPA: amino acid adenylation domain-containing protein [Candidatus Dormibacteraeota bacterium]|nr:amino acid adenylation domain-containing protein [Candidatus Dormibacteraeota bacterium]